MRDFTFHRRYEEVIYDGEQEEWRGFGARILANPVGSERREAQLLFRAYVEDKSREAEDAYWQHVAYRVPEWNLAKEQPDGSVKAYPPPAEDWQTVYELDPNVMIWLAAQIQVAFFPKAQAETENPDSPTDAGTTASTPPTPIRPKSSRKRSGSKETATA